MTFYETEINRIKRVCFSNDKQLETVKALRQYIHSHFNMDMSLNKLSQFQFVSKYHLLRMFKKYYGLTPKQYLIDIRIKKAKEFLTNGSTVTETCFAVGFESLGSFSALFKRKTGQSPAQYQKEQFLRNKKAYKYSSLKN